MSRTRRSAWRTSAVALLLALQLVVAPRSSRAQDAVDATVPTAPPAADVPSAAESPEVTPPAQPVTAEVDSAPAPSDAAPPAAPAARRSQLAPYALWGTSLVGLALGTGFGVMALSAKKDFDDAPTYKRADKVHNLGIAADTSLGLGILLAITGTVFYFVGPPSERTDHGQAAAARPRQHTRKTIITELRIAPLLSHRAQGGTLALRF